MEEKARLPQLVKAVFTPENEIIHRHHINSRAGGIQHFVFKRISKTVLVIRIAQVRICFQHDAERYPVV